MADALLPIVHTDTVPVLDKLTSALSLPRDVVASADEILRAWEQLPRFVGQIPAAERNELHARMCVAIAAGLFDAAINYAWNAAVLKLRQRVREFGINVVSQVISKQFSEQDLGNLQDSELLDLCLRLNLISQEAFKFLDQCRDIRNHFSAAHPPLGALDDSELLAFLNRCTKYALAKTTNPKGVDLAAFIRSLKGGPFGTQQLGEWANRIQSTHAAQRRTIASTIHGIFCDPNVSGDARNNCIDVAGAVAATFDDETWSELISRHSDYAAHGDGPKQAASRQFFEKLHALARLGDAERHAIVANACNQLMASHLAMNNFYNEPPFAKRLEEITTNMAVPDTAKQGYVETVCACAVGNGYGVSWAAEPHYQAMIRNFSPREVEIMFELAKSESRFGSRVQGGGSQAQRFAKLVGLLNPQSIPVKNRREYSDWVR